MQAAFSKVNRQLGKDLRDELKRAAEPVVSSAKGKLGRYQGASVNTIRPRATGRSVFVRQNARKVTGQRGDFGALQMRTVFIPALEENQDKVRNEVEDALDRFIRNAGF